MRIIIFTISILALSFPAFAQGGVSIHQFNAPGFFVAVVAGVILAAAFQLFLTNLSAAAGLSAAGAMTNPSRESSKKNKKDNPGHGGNPGNPSSVSDYTDEIHSTMRSINTGFGLMATITASIALFFATWLALEIISPTNVAFAITVALVIWGLSYLITFILELKVGTTMVGAIAYVAKQSFQSISQLTSQFMRKSEGRREEDKARSITKAVHSELFGHVDLQHQIKDYIHALKPDHTPKDFRNELENLIDELRIEEFVDPHGGPGGIQEVVREIRTSGKHMSKEEANDAANRLRGIVSSTREEMDSQKASHEKAADSAMRATGLSHEEAERIRKNLEDFLGQTGKEQLEPKGIKHDLELLFKDPWEGIEALEQRLGSIDRDTVETLIAQRQDITKDEAHQYVDRVWSVIESYTGRAQEQKADMQAGIEAQKEGAASKKEQALNRIESYIASLDRPVLDAEAIRYDLEVMFSDPKFAAEDLYSRAKQLNREDIMAIVTSNRHISREDADNIVNRIVTIRDEAIHRAEQMKNEITHRVEQAKQEAMHQADQMRKTAASATWWIFIAATVSGVTAVFGGILATVT